jgi:4-hydroxythreonine-4-phosphate dehydrogenase
MKLIGITLGCPAGIGPEIILRYFHDTPQDNIRAVVIGDCNVLRKCGVALGLPANCQTWQPGMPLPPKDTIPVLEVSHLEDDDYCWGKPSPTAGKAMARYIEVAVELALQKRISGITTCPITKAALHRAGYHYPGHTEMLASLTNSRDFAMMMCGSRLKVTLVTIHCPLRKVAAMLSIEAITHLVRLTHQALRCDFGIAQPHIGVAGLNPHSGEEGLFGQEEQQTIAPAVNICQLEGIQVLGPLPPDTIFHHALEGRFDAVVCMYHDQGLIPFKLLHFADGVNITLGLPIIRTSVDHGTAYDIAGKGLANHQSLQAAVMTAASIAEHRAVFCRQKD